MDQKKETEEGLEPDEVVGCGGCCTYYIESEGKRKTRKAKEVAGKKVEPKKSEPEKVELKKVEPKKVEPKKVEPEKVDQKLAAEEASDAVVAKW